MERRSLRYKKHPTLTPHRRTKSFSAATIKSRTSLDLELDLQASETKLQHLQGEIDRLRQLKDIMQQAKARGTDYQMITTTYIFQIILCNFCAV